MDKIIAFFVNLYEKFIDLPLMQAVIPYCKKHPTHVGCLGGVFLLLLIVLCIMVGKCCKAKRQTAVELPPENQPEENSPMEEEQEATPSPVQETAETEEETTTEEVVETPIEETPVEEAVEEVIEESPTEEEPLEEAEEDTWSEEWENAEDSSEEKTWKAPEKDTWNKELEEAEANTWDEEWEESDGKPVVETPVEEVIEEVEEPIVEEVVEEAPVEEIIEEVEEPIVEEVVEETPVEEVVEEVEEPVVEEVVEQTPVEEVIEEVEEPVVEEVVEETPVEEVIEEVEEPIVEEVVEEAPVEEIIEEVEEPIVEEVVEEVPVEEIIEEVEEPIVEEVVEEAPVEEIVEEVIEEPIIEEVVEEAPVEEIVEEPIVEEVVEETPVEEIVEEVVEEPIVEEVVEETPVKEIIEEVEEPIVEEVVEEAPVQTKAKSRSASDVDETFAMVEDMEEDEDDFLRDHYDEDETDRIARYKGKWVVCRMITNEDAYGEMFFFELHAGNGEKLLESEEFDTYQGALRGIQTHRANILKGNFRVSLTKRGDYTFRLLSGKNMLLCIGENYPTLEHCQSAIEMVTRFAATAIIDENVQDIVIRVPAEDDSPIQPIPEYCVGKWIVSSGWNAEDKKVYYFELYADDGERLLESEEYTNYTGAVNGILTLKKNIEKNNFRITLTKRGDYVYKLLNANGQLLNLSEHYRTKKLCQNAVKRLKSFAIHSPMLTDETVQ